MASVEHSLKDLGTDHLDILMIHRPDPFIDPEETGRALDELVASGKTRAIGVSNFKPWDFALLQGAMRERLVTNQIEISLSAHQGFTDGAVADLQARRLRPMAWSPLAGGEMAHGTMRVMLDALAMRGTGDWSDVAVAWLLAHPSGIIPVMGTNRLDRIATIGRALEVKLSREEWFELYTLALDRSVA
jgi:predicted oxidoreductase